MEDNSLLQSGLLALITDYFKTFSIKPFAVYITLVDDMSNEYLKLRPDHEVKFAYANKQEDSNGCVVPPKEFSDSFTILVNMRYILDSFDRKDLNWVGTLAHEATHIVDYIAFAKITGITNYDIIIDKNRFRMFHLWTEFNAKAKGYYFLLKYSFADICDENRLPYILEKELPFQKKIFMKTIIPLMMATNKCTMLFIS
jgi:hypothetical protein